MQSLSGFRQVPSTTPLRPFPSNIFSVLEYRKRTRPTKLLSFPDFFFNFQSFVPDFLCFSSYLAFQCGNYLKHCQRGFEINGWEKSSVLAEFWDCSQMSRTLSQQLAFTFARLETVAARVHGFALSPCIDPRQTTGKTFFFFLIEWQHVDGNHSLKGNETGLRVYLSTQNVRDNLAP